MTQSLIEEMQAERQALLLKYRTTTKDGYPTFDLERFYDDQTMEYLTALRDKTVASLERYPDFGTQFYSDFIQYLNRKLDERSNQSGS